MESTPITKCGKCGKLIDAVALNFAEWNGHFTALNSIVEEKEFEYIAYECPTCHQTVCRDCLGHSRETIVWSSFLFNPKYQWEYLSKKIKGELIKCPCCGKTMKLMRESNVALMIGPIPLVIPQVYNDSNKHLYALKFVKPDALKHLQERLAAIKDADAKGIAMCEMCGSTSITSVKTGCCGSCLSFGAMPGSKQVCAKCGHESFAGS